MIKVIAEIGWNHCGDMKLAKEMILAAKESGATYAKFQSWSVVDSNQVNGTLMDVERFMRRQNLQKKDTSN